MAYIQNPPILKEFEEAEMRDTESWMTDLTNLINSQELVDTGALAALVPTSLRLTSPDGTVFNITVANDGTLSATAV